MGTKTVKVPTQFGPLDVSLKTCDGPTCSTMVQEPYMVQWLKISPQGLDAPTMGGGPPDPMDFCSLTCLDKAVALMMGRTLDDDQS